MPTLTAIKVKIGLRPNGHHDHPNFGQLAVVQASGLDWAKYVDVNGLGWHYDSISGHQDDDPGSPFGTWLGMLVIPEQFAIEALAEFPTLVTRLTETQCEAFYDNKAHIREEEFRRDEPVLSGIDKDLRLTREILAEDRTNARAIARLAEIQAELKRALDPDHESPGVRRNLNRKWATKKTKASITYKESV